MGEVLDHYHTACTEAVLFDMSAQTWIELAGPEARPFLHNLCSNDVKNLPEGSGCEAFLTTAKARVVAHVFINHVRPGEQPVLWLETVPGQAEILAKHLNRYIVSEQVEVFDRTNALRLHRVVGPRAQAIVEALFARPLGNLKHLQHEVVHLADASTVLLRRFDALSLPAFDVISQRDASSWTEKCGVPFAEIELHEILRIEGGLPAFGKDIDENRLVMEIGRTATAISYTKGCFLGQEPIVMARDRGQVNRQLVGIKFSAGASVPPGARLFKADQEVGQVTSSARSPRLDQGIALAYLKRGHQEPGLDVVIEPGSDGRQAVVAALPFLPARP